MSKDISTFKTFRIRDVVYEYISVTYIEKEVIDNPIFQRLRFILQNSSAYLTYPSNQLTRFSHSLGVMHMGGQMFINAINSMNEDMLEEFCDQAKEIIKAYCPNNYENIEATWLDRLGNAANVNILPDTPNANNKIFIVNIIWQSVRIACLIHDIGHFPYSHIFEFAIKSFSDRNPESNITTFFKNYCEDQVRNYAGDNRFKNNFELHELTGLYLISALLKNYDDSGEIKSVSISLARDIFMSNLEDNDEHSNDVRLLKSLHMIFASNIDADRLDYTLRDAQSSGLNIGNFDYMRLLNNIKFHKIENKFNIYFTEKSLSSIEQFFNYRYLLYEYIYYHHNVARFDGILEEIIIRLLSEYEKSQNSPLAKILIDLKFIDPQRGLFCIGNPNVESFSMYDDAWFRCLLQQVYITIEGSEYENLLLLIHTFLYRITENTFSLLKKSSEHERILKNLQDVLNADPSYDKMFKNLNKVTKEFSGKGYKKLKNDIKIFSKCVNYVLNSGYNPKHPNNYIDSLREVLIENGIILIFKNLKPKIMDQKTEILFDGKIKPCSEVSIYLSSFSTIPTFSFNFYFGFVSHKIKSKKNIQAICENKTIETLIEMLGHSIDNELELLKPK